MNRLAGILSCALVSVVIASSVWAWEIDIDNKLGAATYGEKYSNLDSEWNAFYYEGLVAVGHYPSEGLIGGVDFGIGMTPSADEEWDLSNIKIQTNDLKFWQLENNAEIGYVLPFFVDKAPIAPIIGYGWSFTRFERTNFNILDLLISSETIREDVWVHHLDMGFRITFLTHRKDMRVHARAIYGLVLYSSAYNNGYDTTIEGDFGSFLVKGDLGVDYDITEHLTLNFSGFVGIQHLEGGTSGMIVWPENDLNTYGGKIGVTYKF